MQTFNLDISTPSGPLVIYAKQADSMSRFFKAVLSDSGAPWEPPAGSALTVRFGAAGMPAGWYDTITEPDGGTHSAFSVDENAVTVEIAEQAVSSPGKNTLCLLVNGADGYQLASWNFELNIQAVPGLLAPEADVYYNALTEQVAKTLQNAQDAQAAADAAAKSAQEAAASAASVNPDNLLTKAEYGGSAAGIVKKADNATNAEKIGGQIPSWYAPPGMIVPYGGSKAPAGWLLCDGSAVSRTTYASLYAVIGTTYGAGNGSTTFALPDLRGNVPAGVSPDRSLAFKEGKREVTLSIDQIPEHQFTITTYTYAGGTDGSQFNTNGGIKYEPVKTNKMGGGQSHNNMQPTIYLNYIIKI